jgi:hypothetical protein
MLIALFFTTKAEATHFRYGTLDWQPTGGPVGTVKFDLTISLRRGFFNQSGLPQPAFLPNLGDLVIDQGTFLTFGDAAGTPDLWFRVTAISVAEDWIVAEALEPSDTGAINPLTINQAGNAAFRASLPSRHYPHLRRYRAVHCVH